MAIDMNVSFDIGNTEVFSGGPRWDILPPGVYRFKQTGHEFRETQSGGVQAVVDLEVVEGAEGRVRESFSLPNGLGFLLGYFDAAGIPKGKLPKRAKLSDLDRVLSKMDGRAVMTAEYTPPQVDDAGRRVAGTYARFRWISKDQAAGLKIGPTGAAPTGNGGGGDNGAAASDEDDWAF